MEYKGIKYPSPDVRVMDFEEQAPLCDSPLGEVFLNQEEYDDANGWQ